jgi:hypothetical protein
MPDQATLGGQVLDATPADAVFDGDRRCAAEVEDGERCPRYAVVGVAMNDRGLVPACRSHARESWLAAAELGE